MSEHPAFRLSDVVLSRVFGFTSGHPKLVISLLLGLTLLFAAGLPRLSIDTGFSSLIPSHDKSRLVYQRVAAEFGTDNKTLFYVSDSQLWTYAKLKAYEKLHYDLENLEFIDRVDSLVNLRTVEGNGHQIRVFDLLAEVPESSDEIAAIKAQALRNPLLKGQFISGSANAMVLMASIPEDTRFSEERINSDLHLLAEACQQQFENCFQLGSYRINAELKSSLLEDLLQLGPLSVLILIVTLLLFIRSFSMALVPLLTSMLSLVWALGLMGWFQIPLNILTAMLPSLVIVIGSTEDTHLLVTYFQGLAKQKQPQRRLAVQYMLRHTGIPMMLTILTTVLGFASNLFSDIALIRDFAFSSTIAILANGIITMLLVPVMMTLAGPTKNIFGQGNDRKTGLTGLFIRLFETGNNRYPGAILGLTGLLCLFFVYQAASLFVTNDPLSYFRSDRQLIHDVHTMHRDLSGMKTFFISLESEQDKAFLSPENIDKLVEIQAFLKRQGIFDSSLSMADHLSLINREFHGGNEHAYRIPISREQVSQFLMFFHRNDLESYVSFDYRKVNIIVRHNVTDSRTLNRHVEELQKVVNNIAGADMQAFVVGENLMINRAAESLMTAQVKSLLVLLLVIFLLMSLLFTSFKGGFIALIPSLIPIILMFGVMGLLDISLNPGTVMVAVIAIGLAIDGTIHLFTRYNDLCRKTSDNREAVRQTVHLEAVPVVATSLSLSIGFGVLLFSNFTVIAQFGAMAALTMLFSVYANLLITPIIMSRVRLVGLYDILVMRMQQDRLARSPLFRDMTSYQIRKAILISEYVDFHAGDLIIREDSVERSMYLLLEGEVSIIRQGQLVTHMSVGDVFGEIGFVRETLRTADVRADTPVQVLRFDFERIRKDLRYFPNIVAKLNFNISRILGERLAEVINREMSHCKND